MEIKDKTKAEKYVLAIETDSGYRAIKIPAEKVTQVDATLSAGKSIQVGGKFLELDKIVGIFLAEEWKNIKEVLLEEPNSAYAQFKKDMEIYKATGRHPRSKK